MPSPSVPDSTLVSYKYFNLTILSYIKKKNPILIH